MSDIFISYRREDTAGHAGRLVDALRPRFGESRIFMDVDAIVPGADFVRRIEEAVQACRVVLVLIGRDWLAPTNDPGGRQLDGPGDFVRLEVETALKSGVTVIPVLVEGASMPDAQEMPDSIRALARRNAIELSDVRWHYDVDRLCDVIGLPSSDGQSVEPEVDESLATGFELGGYRIVEFVAQGPLAILYRGTQIHSGQEVALKVFAPEYGQDPVFRGQLRRESTVAASIDHPNMLPIYEAGEDDGMLFISERWVRGGNLRRLIDQDGALEAARAVRLIAQVGDVLDEAHAQGLIHAGIHPANILIEEVDHVYVSDFGLIKHAISSRGLTTTGQWLGSIDYVSPEQVKALPAGPQSDVYSLGCVLYEALTGQLPFPGENNLARLWARLDGPPLSFDGFPAVPPGLIEVVRRATMVDPAARFQSAGELAAAALTGAAA